MESWSYVTDEKGFVSDESISAPDVIGRGKNGFTGWELKTPYRYEEGIENQGFVEFNFPEMMRKSFPGNERISTPITPITNPFSVENESSSKLSGPVVESNKKDSSLVDLKLGRIADLGDSQELRSSNSAPMVPSVDSSVPAKRVRAGLSYQTPFCQVYGCKKDLTSCKDYHKRHKVCEVHSKTAKVVVKGIEQRFCQQCSRFHLLSEFDDGKRSCRRRLAGHNERRRKPHMGIHSGKAGRLFQSYNGSTLTTSSFICQDILPSNFLHQQAHDTNGWSGSIKLEDGVVYSSQSAIPVANGHLHPKSLVPHGFEKHCPPFHANGVTPVTGRDFNEISNRYPRDLGSSDSVSGSMVQNTSLGSEDFNLFDSASTVQGLSGMSASGRALSLLSSQSQNYSSHSSGIPMAHPLTISGGQSRYSVSQVSGKHLGSNLSNKVNSSIMNYVDENRFGPILIPDDGDAVNFTDGIFHGSQYINSRDRLSCEEPTIDLLQLSSQLQRVEHQKQSMQKNDGF